MPQSKSSRKKKYRPNLVYNKKIPPKPTWMKVTKKIMIVVLSILVLMAIAGMIIKHIRHIKYHNKKTTQNKSIEVSISAGLGS